MWFSVNVRVCPVSGPWGRWLAGLGGRSPAQAGPEQIEMVSGVFSLTMPPVSMRRHAAFFVEPSRPKNTYTLKGRQFPVLMTGHLFKEV